MEEEDQDTSLVDPSPEHPRAQEEEEVPSSSSCLDSFCQLASSQPQSLLLESPGEVGDGDETDACKRLVPVLDPTSKEPTNQPGLILKSDAPIWDKMIVCGFICIGVSPQGRKLYFYFNIFGI